MSLTTIVDGDGDKLLLPTTIVGDFVSFSSFFIIWFGAEVGNRLIVPPLVPAIVFVAVDRYDGEGEILLGSVGAVVVAFIDCICFFIGVNVTVAANEGDGLLDAVSALENDGDAVDATFIIICSGDEVGTNVYEFAIVLLTWLFEGDGEVLLETVPSLGDVGKDVDSIFIIIGFGGAVGTSVKEFSMVLLTILVEGERDRLVVTTPWLDDVGNDVDSIFIIIGFGRAVGTNVKEFSIVLLIVIVEGEGDWLFIAPPSFDIDGDEVDSTFIIIGLGGGVGTNV